MIFISTKKKRIFITADIYYLGRGMSDLVFLKALIKHRFESWLWKNFHHAERYEKMLYICNMHRFKILKMNNFCTYFQIPLRNHNFIQQSAIGSKVVHIKNRELLNTIFTTLIYRLHNWYPDWSSGLGCQFFLNSHQINQ